MGPTMGWKLGISVPIIFIHPRWIRLKHPLLLAAHAVTKNNLLLPYGHNTVDNPMGPYIKMDP
jgi:hypothetical protein